MIFEILFENNDFIAVDKPPGITSAHESKKSDTSLFELVCRKLNQKLFIVHRLDKEVSGVILFAKSPEVHKQLNSLFAGRKVKKTYEAIVHGIVKETSGVIENPIREFGSGRMSVDNKRGMPAKTEYIVIKQFRDAAHLNVFPKTGRRHQIRVHLYSIGHPIIGDLKYGDKNLQGGFPRLMLHSSRIEFVFKEREFLIESLLPEEMKKFLNSLE